MTAYPDVTDQYEILRELGAGGMAHVYLAHDRKHDRQVAVKVLRPELSFDEFQERFLREVRLVGRLSHPHILPLFDSGQTGDTLYFVMPFVEGPSLRRHLDAAGGRLDVAEALSIAKAIASALDYAHAREVVHRDVKPENIMMHGGVPMLTDFGIGRAFSDAGQARLTETGTRLGTPDYMSPEQLSGEPYIDGRSDLYALAVVLFEMLVGHLPFVGATQAESMAKRFTEKAPDVHGLRADVTAGVAHALQRALALAPADRFETGASFAEALVAPSAAVPEGDAPSPQSVAVLPFANMSSDPEDEYFSDGITEEIINVLAQLPGLHVAARTSSFAFKGQAVNVRDVGAKLRVASVLEGSVRRAGTRLRITAQLINVADGYHLWSERFDREMHDVFAVQDEIATSIGDRLQLSLTRDPDAQFAKPPTDDVTAHELYLKGRFLWNKRTEDSLERAVECFEGAIARDADFALAHAGLADTRLLQGAYSHIALGEARRMATAAAERALALNPAAAEVQASYGQTRRLDRDWAGEEAAYRRALQLNPNYAMAHAWYASLLCARGRHAEAAAEIDRARHLDPLSYAANVTAGLLSLLARQYDAAIRQLHHTIDLEPPDASSAHAYLGLAYLEVGRTEDAVRENEILTRIAATGHPVGQGYGAYVLARAGDVDAARELLQQPADMRGYTPMVAGAYGVLGDKDEAFALLDKSVDEGASWGPLYYAKVHPVFDSLRDDPRFDALLARLGLAD